MGNVYLQLGDYEKALIRYEKTLEVKVRWYGTSAAGRGPAQRVGRIRVGGGNDELCKVSLRQDSTPIACR